MRGLVVMLLVAGGAGVLATFGLALSGDTPGAMRAAGMASSALILGIILHRR
ncbi:hypothetical protein J8J14_16665 [Roseomonas sp. SSH11]|uniref:Uncharacterized protein n=1 Tax=Pararoseomonas baculiformis TaxID=2820812 RepID=A0ABS4AJL0_9PROT|nr:hypothetical protein [Pararoseomonas baculiformis]MBP0446409.1 hypothetical protein [Pararoseomonas baculiformis]